MHRTAAIITFLLSSFVTNELAADGPLVRTPTSRPKAKVKTYPWKKDIVATIFWVGEKPTPNNPTPNHASSWDTKWQINFGGFDDPNNRAPVGFRPAKFVPKLNPFYIALPFNDRENHKYIKPIVPKVVPWYHASLVQKGQSCLKGRWLQIVFGNRSCYAQWEDCGPFNTTDEAYVFGNQRPKNLKNKGAGIDLSPAIRDFLQFKSGQKVHWRFVEEASVPPGPWDKYMTKKPGGPPLNETATEKYLREGREFRERYEAELEKERELLRKSLEAQRQKDKNR